MRRTSVIRQERRARRAVLPGAAALVVASLLAVAPAAGAATTTPTVTKIADTSYNAPGQDVLSQSYSAGGRIYTVTYAQGDYQRQTLRSVKADGSGAVSVLSTQGGYIGNATRVGDELWFTVQLNDGSNAQRLVRTDGTVAGTTTLRTFQGYAPQNLRAVGGKVYFAAGDATTGQEPWVSDGTADGTRMIKDLFPGVTNYTGGSYPNSGGGHDFTAVGDKVAFSASDGPDGGGLFMTDGTAAGTTKVRGNLYLNGMASSPRSGELLFVAYDRADTAAGYQLFRSDGTTAGTKRVFTDAGVLRDAYELTRIGDRVIFRGTGASHGNELWTSDGTADGTTLLKDIRPGGDSYPQNIVKSEDGAYFRAYTGTTHDVWKTDGTAAGTRRVFDTAASGVQFTSGLVAIGRSVFFQGYSNGRYRLWTGDGTADGTQRVTGADDLGDVTWLTAAGDRLAFFGRDADTGYDLFTASTEDRTPPKATITDGPTGLTKDRSPAFRFEADEADEAATFECRITGATTTDWATCTSPFTPAALADGDHALEVRPTDAAGNVGDVVRRTFRVDATAPRIDIARPYDGARYSHFADDKPELRSDYDCADPGSGVVACTGTVADGEAFDRSHPGTDPFVTRTFTVSATDLAGNTATRTSTYRVFTFASLVLDDAPAGYWRLGGADSPTMDALAGPSGVFKNELEAVPWGISGDGDSARRLADTDGNGVADGYAAVDGMEATPSYSMSLFFDPADDRRTQSLMQQGGSGAVWYDGSGAVRFRPVDWLGVELSGAVTGDGFHHVVATYAWTPDPDNAQLGSGVAKLYVDGRLADTRTADRRPSGSSTLYVGYGDKAHWFQGEVDEAAVFPAALSATHVHEIWLAD
ncbi:MAG: hypothetical protein F2817_00180, partial [Actinobacteria bacterium]|nr:hypothetical protein [Actinomycetota bacterium]